VVKGGMTGDEGVTERGYGGGVRVRGGIIRGDEDGGQGRTEERKVEGARGFVRGLGRYRRLKRVSFVLGEKGRCNLDLECPECVEARLRTEPRRLFRHLAAMILEHRRAHKSGRGRF